MTDETKTSLRRRTVLGLVAGLGTCGAARLARANVPDLVTFSVVDRETGEPLRVWLHAGRAFVAGRPGARYSLRVANQTGGRVLVVMSVDGVNILTGETAGYGQSGYVFDPWESYDIAGWRKSDRQVAAFTFAPLSRSYAARTGRPDDVGVIGIAAFTERYVPPPVAVAPADAAAAADAEVSELVVGQGRLAAPAPPAARARPSEKLGTGHGAREWSAVTTVAFQRATAYPQLIRRIEYDSYPNLVAAGIIRPRADPYRRPRPFPSEGYVPDPPGGR